MLKRATPTEQPVGWFYTSSDVTENCLIFHDYYNRILSDVSLLFQISIFSTLSWKFA